MVGGVGRTARSVRELAREAAGSAAAAGAPGADPAEHADLARAAGRGARTTGARGHHVPVRGPGLQRTRGQPAHRQRRARPDLDRRAPGRARRRADGHAPQRARGGRRAQPARRGGGDAAPRRRTPRARQRWAQARRIIADPERAAQAAGLGTVHTFVLGGGGGPRDLEVPLTTDMEQIDPRTRDAAGAGIAPTPAGPATWPSSCSPARATVRMSRITNRRWALSAFGTASSAALVRRGHRLQRHAAVSPLRPDDEHRRRDRRRRPAGDGLAISTPPRSGTRSAATASPSPPTPGRCCTTSSRRRPTRRAPPPGPAVHRLGHAARAVAAGPAALRARPRARVLRLDRGRGDPRQPPRRQAGRDGPAAARHAPRCGSPPTTMESEQLDPRRRRLRAARARPTRSGCCSPARAPSDTSA